MTPRAIQAFLKVCSFYACKVTAFYSNIQQNVRYTIQKYYIFRSCLHFLLIFITIVRHNKRLFLAILKKSSNFAPTKQKYNNVDIPHSVKIKDVISALERFAPLPLQEDYDNAGLQVGLTEAEVSGALLCLDVTESIVREAIDKGCNLIVSHHPLIFRKLRHITDEDYVQRTVTLAIKNDIAIVAMHTNLDSVEGGVNFMIARKLGAAEESIRFIGIPQTINGRQGGMGIICQLPQPLTPTEYVALVKSTFNAQCVMTNACQRRIQSVAICGGAGSFLLGNAVNAGADALLTGEMHYHEFFGHENDILISVIGHYESEQFTQQLLQEIINSSCPEVKTHITQHNTNPIRYW